MSQLTTRPMRLPRLTLDREGHSPRFAIWQRARRAEIGYAIKLRKVARHIGDIVKAFAPFDAFSLQRMEMALLKYEEAITPWAESVAKRMVAEVASREGQQWSAASAEIGRGVREQIQNAPIGHVVQKSMAEQVDLIKSIPRSAAERVHKLAFEMAPGGKRAETMINMIMDQGKVSRSRAELIARTETGRLSTEFTKARAEHIGSTHFIWRTAGDGNVRESHRRLNGKAFRWDEPPECDPGYHALPGAIFNCRCYAEPIYPEDDE